MDPSPFTCAWLPGQGNLKLMFGIYLRLILFLADTIPRIQALALDSLRGYLILTEVLALACLFVARRARRRPRCPADAIVGRNWSE